MTRSDGGRLAFLADAGLDVVLPLALFYGLRAAGVSPSLALVLGGVVPVTRLVLAVARRRSVNGVSVATLSLIVVGTLVSLVTGDARLLLARGSYLTAIAGLWVLGSLLRPRPVIFEATLAVMPPDQADSWRRQYEREPGFRKIWRVMTVWWAVAFLLDAAARVAMAYTMPVDVVPVASSALLVVLLLIVVQGSKAYGRRLLGDPAPDRQQ